MAPPGPGAAAGSRAVDLGAPQLVDGFANGWPSAPADLHAAGRSGLHGRADLDPPARGLGRARRLRRDPCAVPRARLPPPTGPAPGPRLAAPPAARPGGAGRARTAGRALRRRGAGPALHTAAEGPAPPAGCASRGPCSSARSPVAWQPRAPRRRAGPWWPASWPGAPRPMGPRHSPRWGRWPSSWPAASTSCRGRTCTITCRAPTGPARSSMPAT